MATRRGKGQLIEGEVTARASRREEPSQPIQEEYFDVDENVARFLAERGENVSDATVKVYKAGGPGAGGGRNVPAPTVRDAFLYQCAPDEFNEELLQGSYGAGTYRLKMYGTNPQSGAYAMLVNRILEIGPAPAWKKAEAPPATLNGVPIHVNGGGGDIAHAIAQMLQPLFAQFANAPKPPTRAEMLAEMQTMAAILKGDAPAARDPIAELAKLAPIIAMLGGAKAAGVEGAALDDESGPYAVLMKGIEALSPAVQQWLASQGKGAVPAAPQKLLNAPAVQGSGEAPNEATPTEEEQMNLFLQGQMTLLLMAAKSDGNPELYAAMIYEQAPDSVITMLESATWFEELCKIAPDFATVKPWCEKVRALVLEDLKAERAEDAATAGNGSLPQSPDSGKSEGNAREIVKAP